jgi:hypothetical protein
MVEMGVSADHRGNGPGEPGGIGADQVAVWLEPAEQNPEYSWPGDVWIDQKSAGVYGHFKSCTAEPSYFEHMEMFLSAARPGRSVKGNG